MGAGGRRHLSTAEGEQQQQLHEDDQTTKKIDHSAAPGVEDEYDPKRGPCSKPPFTLGDIKKAIPPHCFKRSILRSFSYILRDIISFIALAYVAANYIPLLPNSVRYIAWPTYWFLQGCILMAFWVIGHESGHHALSEYQLLDDITGFIVHSAVFTPFYSWKYSHKRHHLNTGSLERDEVHVPKPKDELWSSAKYLNNPPGRILTLIVKLSMGWYLYLSINAAGRSYDRFASHYDPKSPIYFDSERSQILLSDIGLVATALVLSRFVSVYGFSSVFFIYFGPLIVCNAFVVIVTYLQHTHLSLPHYNNTEWDWLRGALCTIDRSYGPFLNHVLHNVTDTHVVHHLFSTMPHYNAKEATEAIKPLLGEYYQVDDTPFMQALWRESKRCIYVEEDEKHRGVFWYDNKL